MSFKEMYYYVFYKFYKFFEAFKTTRWLTDTKSGIVLGVLEVFVLFSLINYYDLLVGQQKDLDIKSVEIFLPLLIIVLIKWFFFIKDDTWKDYVLEFDKWPKEKNRKGTWIVAGVILTIMANFIFSLYLNPPPGGLRW